MCVRVAGKQTSRLRKGKVEHLFSMKAKLARLALVGAMVATSILVSAPSASAVSCDPGFTLTGASFKYTNKLHENISGATYSSVYIINATGCYKASTGQTEGLYISGYWVSRVYNSLGYWEITGSGIYPWTGGQTDWRTDAHYNDPWGWGYFYMRVKLKPTGEWYPGGWKYSCSFGLAGGWCSMSVVRS